ncbi:MAG TPA: AmmeMemoRadiSam system protein B [Anaerolineae bacterium]
MSDAHLQHKQGVRQAQYAGTWYPGDELELRQSVSRYLSKAKVQTFPARPRALICPHPGHIYGGAIAATSITQVKGLGYKRVVLLGPLHRPLSGGLVDAFMVPRELGFATPLGVVPVDVDFITALAHLAPLTFVSNDREHSLEIELPFLQVALESFTLVPIMIGLDIQEPGAPETLLSLAKALASLADDDTLFVASTDLSHLDNYADVVRIDHKLVELVNAFDISALIRALADGQVYACGATALVTVLQTGRLLGATSARVLACMNSGDITHEQRPGHYTVGYMAAVAY